MDFAGLEDLLRSDGESEEEILNWYEKIAEYEIDGNESTDEINLLFQATKYLMSYAFTSAEELRSVTEAEAVAMAERENAWEEQRALLKEELEELREQITSKADIGDSTATFRAQIESLKEENLQLQQFGRDRDREMADQRDRFESIVSRVEAVTRERDGLIDHKIHLEDTIRELNRRISAKSEESSSDWEGRKLRQRNEQALTLSRQLQAVVAQNEELREEIERVSEALQEATRIIEDSALRYTDLSEELENAQKRVQELADQNRRLTEGLPDKIVENLPKCISAAEKMLSGASTDKIDFLWQMSELLLPSFLTDQDFQALQDTTGRTLELELQDKIDRSEQKIGSLQEELAASVEETNNLRRLIREDRTAEKEEELEQLRMELVSATSLARNLFGEAMLDKSGGDATLTLQMRIFQLEQAGDELRKKIEENEKKEAELLSSMEEKDMLNMDLAAELERFKNVTFGSAREEIRRLETQLKFRDEQIAELRRRCTLLHVELGQYAEKLDGNPEQRLKTSIKKPTTLKTAGSDRKKPPSTLPRKPKELPSPPFTEEATSSEPEERKLLPKKSDQVEKSREAPPKDVDYSEVAHQAVLISNLYFELMQLLEELSQKDGQLAQMKAAVSGARKSTEQLKAQLNLAYDEIRELKRDHDNIVEKTLLEARKTEESQLRALVDSLGNQTEQQNGEATRRLVIERIERIRLARQCAILKMKCSRAEVAGRRIRDNAKIRESEDGRRIVRMRYQMDNLSIEMGRLQNRVLQSVHIEEHEKLLRKYKQLVKETVGVETAGDEIPRQTVSITPSSVTSPEHDAETTMLKKMNDVISEQHDFWRDEASMLQEENHELKKFIEDMENESDLRSVLGAVERRLLTTIRELRQNGREQARDKKSRGDAKTELTLGREKWRHERSAIINVVQILQRENTLLRSQSVGTVSLQQLELLRKKIVEARELQSSATVIRNEANRQKEEVEMEAQKWRAAKSASDVLHMYRDLEVVEKQLEIAFLNSSQQSAKAKTLERSLHTKERQLANVNEELEELKEHNTELMTALENLRDFRKVATQLSEFPKKEENLTLSLTSGTSVKLPMAVESDYESDIASSSGDSSHAENFVVRTVVQDNTKEFEARIRQLKETAEVALRGYREQLAQKDVALEQYKELLRERLGLEHEETQRNEKLREQLEHDLRGELQEAETRSRRLEKNLEELTEANRILYSERRREVILNDEWTQTREVLTEREEQQPTPKTNNSNLAMNDEDPRSLDVDKLSRKELEEEVKMLTEELNNRHKADAELQRQKAEIRSLRSKYQRLNITNKELLATCEQIRADALAELSSFKRNNDNVDANEVVGMRLELEKLRGSNRTMRSLNQSLKSEIVVLKNELSRMVEKKMDVNEWERKKRNEELIASLKKRLVERERSEKEAIAKLAKREKLLEDLRREQTVRHLEFEKSQRRLKDVRNDKEVMQKSLENVKNLNEKAASFEEKLRKKEQELSTITATLRQSQRDFADYRNQKEQTILELRNQNGSLQTELQKWRFETENRSQRQKTERIAVETQTTKPRVTISDKETFAPPPAPMTSSSSSPPQSSSSSSSSSRSQSVENWSSIVTTSTMKMTSSTSSDFNEVDLKKKLRLTELRLAECQEKLEDLERDHGRLLDQFQRLVARSTAAPSREEKPLGAVRVLSDKLEAKDREIMQLKAHIAHLERRVIFPIVP
ncbi:unnamed protein product [Caenorhabditis auriculariae]|uniref:Uncharacterized protein n=1 Tax=Caenorhabditis auriculariae TaxID=2777116 RepID=A0A8S1GUH3_9PELO|nr:unnamed protein product [Caenorhabditis auriculariae]